MDDEHKNGWEWLCIVGIFFALALASCVISAFIAPQPQYDVNDSTVIQRDSFNGYSHYGTADYARFMVNQHTEIPLRNISSTVVTVVPGYKGNILYTYDMRADGKNGTVVVMDYRPSRGLVYLEFDGVIYKS